jgi:hypothetical protein
MTNFAVNAKAARGGDSTNGPALVLSQLDLRRPRAFRMLNSHRKVIVSSHENLQRMLRFETLLLGVGNSNCVVCELLSERFSVRLSGGTSNIKLKAWHCEGSFRFAWANCDTLEETQAFGLNLRVFPTVIGFIGGKARVGWEGFSALAQTEIKDKIVQDAISEFKTIIRTLQPQQGSD